ncbi:MAG TPA: hypothetical protein VE242_15005 [Chthoniobacterales bacterium]|nr:hypothetical protein [Chthoniobacterales bacterium]
MKNRNETSNGARILEFIGKMNRDLIQALFGRRREQLNAPNVVQHPSHQDARVEA